MQIKNEDAKKDAPLLGMGHPVVAEYKLIKKNIIPQEIVDATVKLNKIKQNNFDGYKGKQMVQQSSVPEMIHQQLKEQSGLEHRTGLYDTKKYNAILDDSDNKYLRTVPHKIGNRKREI